MEEVHQVAKHVVLALFPSEAAADAAVESLKAWDKANGEVAEDSLNANAIGILVLDEKGNVKTRKLGRRTIPKGIGVGAAMAVMFATGPIGMVGLPILGGIAGRLHRKSLGLKGEDRERIAAELAGGKAAVGVLVNDVDVPVFAAKLEELGGIPEAYPVPVEADEEVQKAYAELEAEAAREEAEMEKAGGAMFSA